MAKAVALGMLKRPVRALVKKLILLSFVGLPGSESLAIFMGLLKVGVPKTWGESKKDLGYVRKAGVRQFISTYNRVKDLKGDELLWGDEIEYGIFKLDHENKKARLSLRAKHVSFHPLYRVKLSIFS